MLKQAKTQALRFSSLVLQGTFCERFVPFILCSSFTSVQLEFKGRFPLRKISIGSDWAFFHFVLSAQPDQKKLKILQLFIIRVADHRFKLEQKIGTESPCASSILFRSSPIPMLIFLSGNRSLPKPVLFNSYIGQS